uniref:Uncharacterized protein n=1 Tax=Arundo donax TaxID=35708 RepID=A0A0A9DNT0_ARUDO
MMASDNSVGVLIGQQLYGVVGKVKAPDYLIIVKSWVSNYPVS